MFRTNEITLKDALKKLVSAYGLKSKSNQQRLKDHWAEVVGPMINKHTRDVYLQNRKLIVMISNPQLKQELHYMKGELAQKINDYLKENLVDEVVIR